MSGFAIAFYIGAALTLIFAIMAVTSRRLLRAAIYLLFVLIGVAVFYLVIDYMFLAAVQIVVYMGGILVLIIFSILLTSHINEKLEVVKPVAAIFAALISMIGAGVAILVIRSQTFVPVASENEITVFDIGTKLLSYQKYGYVLPFEVISILLLAAMVAAIVIAKREKKTDS